jgi:hypothetical protein
LIELVRARPILYDRASAQYKDSRLRKLNNWKDVAEELNKQTEKF